MANIVKTQGTSILALQSISHTAVVVSDAIDVSTKLAATIFIRFGRRTASALTAGWPNFRIEGSAKSSGTDAWIPLATFQPAIGATIADRTLDGAHAGGVTSILVRTAITNLAIGDLIFIEAATLANSEWARIRSFSGLNANLEEALTNSHEDGSAVRDQAELFVAQLDLTSIGRIRVVADNANSGQTIAVEAKMVTGDSLT